MFPSRDQAFFLSLGEIYLTLTLPCIGEARQCVLSDAELAVRYVLLTDGKRFVCLLQEGENTVSGRFHLPESYLKKFKIYRHGDFEKT